MIFYVGSIQEFPIPLMNEKEKRPFIGLLFEVNSVKYFAPLSSPKPKHLQMKNTPDFLKINDGKWGAINFNNMIPVCPPSLNAVDMKYISNDSIETRKYKELLNNQLDWCNKRERKIVGMAGRLYEIVTKGLAQERLLKRCCDFSLLEKKCLEFNAALGVPPPIAAPKR